MVVEHDRLEHDVLVRLRAGDHHGTACFTNDVLRDRAEEQALHARLAVRADEDEIRADLGRDPEDLGHRAADAHVHEEVDILRGRPAGEGCGDMTQDELVDALRGRVAGLFSG